MSSPSAIPDHLVNSHYADRYFDVVNAIAEARHVYFEGCEILQHLRQHRRLHIGETGFGAGRVLLSLLCFLDEQAPIFARTAPHTEHSNTPNPSYALEFASVELHPLSVERLEGLLTLFKGSLPTIDGHIQQIVKAYRQFDLSPTPARWQSQWLDTALGPLELRLWMGEALEMVQEVSERDVWFLEGHGPKANPEIWRPELLAKIGEKTRVGGHCATFTVAGHIRRDLRAAGFNTRRLPGIGLKKEVLQGQKRAPQQTLKGIQLEAYNPDWPQHFEALKTTLTQRLKSPYLSIEHVGSTSVPGLVAQPTLTLDIVVSSHWAVSAILQEMAQWGYTSMRHGDTPGCEVLVTPEANALYPMAHQIYVCPVESPTLHQHLLLRDYLRQSPEQTQAYSALKSSVVKRYPTDHNAYKGAKTRFLNRLLAEARENKG